MGSALFDITPLLPIIENGAVVLTPNNRLRNQLRLSYSESQDSPVVRSPNIFSLTEWLNLQWEVLSGNGHNSCDCLILNTIQQQTIWTQIVENSQFADASANYKSLVSHLMEAYKNIQLWEISLEEIKNYHFDFISSAPQDDYLLSWITAFEDRLISIKAITPEQSQKIICEAFENNILPPKSSLFLQSFDDLPPLTHRLFKAASKKLFVSSVNPESNPVSNSSSNTLTQNTASKSLISPSINRVGCTDFTEEVMSAARWARDTLHKHPESKIGIIVPSLGNDRQIVERVFTEIFEPQFLNPQVPRYPLPFNISAGTPLANTPLIDNTLLLLRLHQNELSINEWQQLLLSPFFSDEENERDVRSRLILSIKKRQQFSISTAIVRELLTKDEEKQAFSPIETQPESFGNILSNKLQSFEDKKRHHPKTATASEWIMLIQEQLAGLGWPGIRTLDSVEYQQVNQWYSLLEKLASLDAINENPDLNKNTKKKQEKNTSWTFSKILNTLTGLAATTHFQPEVKGSPINILGTLEAAGLAFTHSWIMGMNNKDWPPKPNPNPILPIQLQRKYQLPRASIERENRYAQAITKQLLQSANEIVVSYVTQFEESESLPSALIEHVPLQKLSTIFSSDNKPSKNTNTLSNFYLNLNESQQLDVVNCENGPKLAINKGIAKGGSDILKQQALCPFTAFAKHRLAIRQPDEPTLALTALDKGNIIHNALDVFWSDVQSHKHLVSLSTEDIQEKITSIIERVFTHQYKRDIQQLGDFYYSLEKTRFIRLLVEWLEFEKSRPPFTVIGTEESIDADFSGLTFKLRVDRIDKNEAGEIILLDYKTGTVATKKLKGPRPEEPQLPLYLLCYPEEVKAIAFAQIKTNEFQIAGIGEITDQHSYEKINNTTKEKISSDWTSAKDYFKTELGALAQEYINGYCIVDFKTNDPYEKYLSPLNRKNESDFVNYYISDKQPEGGS